MSYIIILKIGMSPYSYDTHIDLSTSIHESTEMASRMADKLKRHALTYMGSGRSSFGEVYILDMSTLTISKYWNDKVPLRIKEELNKEAAAAKKRPNPKMTIDDVLGQFAQPNESFSAEITAQAEQVGAVAPDNQFYNALFVQGTTSTNNEGSF